ncbi:MAG TPA: hypothetical protein DEQ40_20755 [Oxalobacteraceae bacterium]|nr:hypothetical protein [Oxalobacteraceae bacterium]
MVSGCGTPEYQTRIALVLMGHAVENMSEHYATPTVARLVDMANLVAGTRDTMTLLRVVNGR